MLLAVEDVRSRRSRGPRPAIREVSRDGSNASIVRDAGPAGDQAVPGRRDVVAERGDHAHPGHDDAAAAPLPRRLIGRASRCGPWRRGRRRPGRPRAEIALATASDVELGAPDLGRRPRRRRCRSAPTRRSGRRRRRSRPMPSLTISFQPRSRTSGRWVWPQAMTRASVRDDPLDDRRSGRAPGRSRPSASPARRGRRGPSCRRSARSRRSAGSRRSQASRSSPSASWAHSAAARKVSGTPSVIHGNAAA